ncbi:MAG: hypothetical protein SF052_26715 [Bacteroidia bacterium]|nr:hypothetical protein [Bacteroidia bacterium]
MEYLLYFLASVIIIHKAFLVYGMTYFNARSKHAWLTGSVGIFMIATLIVAMFFESWPLLIISFAGYMLYNFGDSIWLSLRYHRQPSVFLPVYVLMFASTIIALTFEAWIFFTVSYGIYWLTSLILGKRLLNRSIQSQKI